METGSKGDRKTGRQVEEIKFCHAYVQQVDRGELKKFKFFDGKFLHVS